MSVHFEQEDFSYSVLRKRKKFLTQVLYAEKVIQKIKDLSQKVKPSGSRG